jgi:hypothetical protein
MHTLPVILAAIALLFTGPGAALAGCGSGQIVQIGIPNGDPEKDTFGLICGTTYLEQTSAIAGSARGEILQVGVSTGEAEKDSVGYLQTASAQ